MSTSQPVETPPPSSGASRNGTGSSSSAEAAPSSGASSGAPLAPSVPAAVPALLARLQPALRLPSASSVNAPAATVNAQATELAAELIQARRQGMLGLFRLRFEAWLEERMKGPILRKMAVRREVMEAQMQTTQAEISLHAAVKGGQKDVERHEIEWNRLRGQRLVTDLERLGITLSAGNDNTPAAGFGAPGNGNNGPTNLGAGIPATPAAPVSLHLSDEQIEQLALRAVLHLGPMGAEGAASQAEWDEYRTELHERLPAFAAQEVERRINELCALAQ